MAGLGALCVFVFLLAPQNSAGQIAVFFTPLVAAVVALVWRVTSLGVRATGSLWLLVSAALIYALVVAVGYIGPVVFGLVLPFPSVVDLLFFATYIAFSWFLVGVIRGLPGRESVDARTSLIDALLLTSAMCSVIWVWWIRPASLGESPLAVAATLGYPVLTLLMFGVAARLALTLSGRAGGIGLLLLVWIAGEIVGDIHYGILAAAGKFTYGDAYSVPWMVSYTALAALAVHPRLTELTGARARTGVVVDSTRARKPRRMANVVVPLGAAMVPVVLVWADTSQTKFLLLAATLSMGLVGLRLSLSTGDLRTERALRVELDEHREHLSYRVFHDPLTGLPNRALFADRLEVQVNQRDRGRGGAMILVDLDGFKRINDTYGHAAGDRLLVKVAERLTKTLRQGDSAARLGGDEFATLLVDVDPHAILAVASRFQAAICLPADLGPAVVTPSASMGIALINGEADARQVMHHADVAMYAAKHDDADKAQLYDASHHGTITSRFRAESEIKTMVSGGQLRVFYQPVLRLADRSIVGAEALVRWEHPERGLLPPAEFLDVAERTGFILDLGREVLRIAVHQVADWNRMTQRQLQVAVNVSAKQWADPTFADMVEEELGAAGLDPALLSLEVTETAMISLDTDFYPVVERLRSLGVRIAIDDFGTGYSSLSYLRWVPFDILKIDRAFVTDLEQSTKQWSITWSIVQLAQRLGATTVAEGVETAAQLTQLRALGCPLGQGYLFDRPLPADEFEQRLIDP